jgi:hypothetical protein
MHRADLRYLLGAEPVEVGADEMGHGFA